MMGGLAKERLADVVFIERVGQKICGNRTGEA